MLEGSVSGTKSNASSLTNNNSNLNFKNLSMNTNSDLIVKGANVNTQEKLKLDVKGDLIVHSVQDVSSSSSNSASVGSSGSVSSSLNRTSNTTTVFSSLIANEVNANVKGTTNLKASLISAQNEDGTVNNNLNLNTNTLKISNLSNRTNSKNVSLGGSTGSTVSANLSIGNNNSKTKTLATITNGNINVNNIKDSSDIKKLNRNKDDINLDIYDVKSDVSVSMELDTRMLSKDGRKQIKEDIKVSSKISDTVIKIATLKDVGITDFFKQTNQSVKQYEAYKKVLASNKDLANKLSNKNLSLEEKQKYQNQFKEALEKELGYKLAKEIKTISTDEKGQGNKDIAGYISNENDTIYSNDKNQNSTSDTIEAMGQELAGAIQKHKGIDITTNRKQHNNYQDSIAKDTVDDISFIMNNYHDKNLATSNSHNQATSKNSIFNLQDNNNEFKKLDKENGDNSIYMYGGKVVGTDGINDGKVIDLTFEESFKFRNKNKYANLKDKIELVNQEDTSKYKKVYNLNNKDDFETLKDGTDMNYYEINSNTDIVFENGMMNTKTESQASQEMIQKDFPNKKVGLINNITGDKTGVLNGLE